MEQYLPRGLTTDSLRTAIPRLAKDAEACASITDSVRRVPTKHLLRLGDSRVVNLLPESVHLVLTSPPYWTLKGYNDDPGQLGHVADYGEFLDSLDEVWRTCLDGLVPGGRLVCVVGDVCLSRKKNKGRHSVIPLHSSVQERCRALGFDNLTPIIWHKIANASYESGAAGGTLGKPYEPNAVIKNDVEYVLMLRKPGGYRKPTEAARLLSVIPEPLHRLWFRQVWTGLPGASTKGHPAPYPLELAERLVRMFSFAGDTVFDPFLGTGTTSLACKRWGRNSVGVEIDKGYLETARARLDAG